MTDPLKDFVHTSRNITRDEDARAFLVHLNIFDKFDDPAGLSDGLSHVRAIFYDAHITHWIIGVHYYGFSKIEENGYVVNCIPKSKFSELQAIDLRNKIAKAPGGFEVYDSEKDPGRN
jgi:hypothetical protein